MNAIEKKTGEETEHFTSTYPIEHAKEQLAKMLKYYTISDEFGSLQSHQKLSNIEFIENLSNMLDEIYAIK